MEKYNRQYLQILHIPSDLLLNGATWLHCMMLVQHICCSGETWFLQNTLQAEALQVVLHGCENQKFMVALGGSGMWTFQVGKDLLSVPNGGLGRGLENHATKHLDSMGLLNLPVVSCNSFICIYCGMGNHAHFRLTLFHFLLVSPYTIIHSNHFWPRTFLFLLIKLFLTTKIFLSLVSVFPYCEYSFSTYLCQR